MNVEIETIYRYKLMHPIDNEYLEVNIYSKECNARWEKYLTYFQEWLQKQRDNHP